MPINTTPVPSYDPFNNGGGAAGAVNALVDLGEAMRDARNRGSKSEHELAISNPTLGQTVCDLLPEPPEAREQCCNKE